MTGDLFEFLPPVTGSERLGDASGVLRGFALPDVPELLPALEEVIRCAPLRHMLTPGGRTMSVALTNCGALGWTSDRRGYRYAREDPQTGAPWPAMPPVLLRLAQAAARASGFGCFTPDACLINRYVPGARLSLHQDRNERDFRAPIVSVSLGLPALFLFGGNARTDRAVRVPLFHGDVAVWGGVDRLRFHGVLALKAGEHPLLGCQRINLTFRRAG